MSHVDSYVSGTLHLGGLSGLTGCRLHVWTGSPPSLVLASNGGDVDAVSTPQSTDAANGTTLSTAAFLAIPGLPVRVEAGGGFSAGALLQSDGSGRAVARSTGVGVLRALEPASGVGSIVWAVFTSGR